MEAYCVLISVYYKDHPEWLRDALQSIFSQSYLPSQIVLVEDGPLTKELYEVIAEFSITGQAGLNLDIVKIPENGGLGPALNEGLRFCKYDLVARMDADDISLPDRCRKQVEYMSSHPSCSVLSGTVAEFEGTAPESVGACVKKMVPYENQEIRSYAFSRNPVNHPCAMFRKGAVEKAGGYRSVPYFEDYDLWLRMLFDHGMEFANLRDVLLFMRTDGMYERRGGIRYAGYIRAFRKSMYERGYLGYGKYIVTTSLRMAVSIMPASLRRNIYRKMLRK